jgi:hypothetical protein
MGLAQMQVLCELVEMLSIPFNFWPKSVWCLHAKVQNALSYCFKVCSAKDLQQAPHDFEQLSMPF